MSTSPLPCPAWPSPTSNSAPRACTGIKSLVPATSSLLSRLPAWNHGGPLLMRPSASGGATPMLPKNGRSGISIRSEKRATIRRSSSGMILIREYGNSSGRNPAPGRKPLYAYGTASRIAWILTSSVSPGSAPSIKIGPVRMWPPGPFVADLFVDGAQSRLDLIWRNASGFQTRGVVGNQCLDFDGIARAHSQYGWGARGVMAPRNGMRRGCKLVEVGLLGNGCGRNENQEHAHHVLHALHAPHSTLRSPNHL